MGILSKILGAFGGGGSTVTPAEAKRLLDSDPGVVLLDVRQAGEYKGGFIPRAKHVPVGLVPQRAAKLDPAKTYVVYCRSGARSSKAARALAKAGFRDVRNLRGGILAWQASGYPVTKR